MLRRFIMIATSLFSFDTMMEIADKYAHLFIDGFGYTLLLSAITVFFGSLLGFIVYFAKASNLKIGGVLLKNNPKLKANPVLNAILSFKPISFIANVYIEIIRGTPLLLQLYIGTFLVPELLNTTPDMFVSVSIALVVNSGAYVSEIIRSGVQAVDKGQDEAARSLGFSKFQTMLYVIMPQAIRNILPSIGNEFVMVIKETSLASTFFVGDLMTTYKELSAATYQSMEVLVLCGIIYFVTTFTLSNIIRLIERRMGKGD